MFQDVTAAAAIPHLRSLLRSCALRRRPPSLAHQLHSHLLKSGGLSSSLLSSPLFHFYAAAGPPSAALLSFHSIPPSLLSPVDWTALLSSLSRHSLPSLSLRLFRSMFRSSSRPDEVTLLSLLSAAAQLAHLPSGASAHLLFFKLGLPFTLPSRNAAIHMYFKCDRLHDARRLFDETHQPNIISWTILLSVVCKSEPIEAARKLFDQMPERNEVTWTIMIAGYIEGGLPREALFLLSRLLFSDDLVRRLNHISLCSLLSSCSQAGDLTTGRWIHTHVTKLDFENEDHRLMVSTALVDMYGKCGRVGAARRLFEAMRIRNLVSWNAMMSGLSMHGMGFEVLRLFRRMVEEGTHRPDDITFVSVLSACSRSGLLMQGQKIFCELSSVYGLTPKIEHYACMVDLLGRAGKLEEAEALIKEMPILPNEVVLGSLLASCSLHGKLELGKKLMHELVEIDPKNTEYHVLLSNLYSSHGRHAEADELWKQGSGKGPGVSYIEIGGCVHRFKAGDKSHPQTQEVYAKLEEMVQRLRLRGYVPNATSQVSRIKDGCLQNGVEREEQEQALLYHSERLAIAFGLINTRPGVSLRIFKNLRICSDCHRVIKLVSVIFGREIVVRDRNRFHCFNQGTCSCSDYW